ncbi:H/ACA ribonucleoprotein complex subunit 2-like protein [Blattella germanica]|nr:H/ACA ribonucleoprotein complex subunit 2-like protein [Blattella germanica]
MEDAVMFDVSNTGNTSCVQDAVDYTNPIAHPMAPSKLVKKICKLIKESVAAGPKLYVRSGLKDVQASLRKKQTGIIIFSGDVTPIEIMCHLPAVCEERDIPYCYVRDKQILGTALGVKRGALMVLIKKCDKTTDLFNEVTEKINALPPPWKQ